MSVRVHQRLKDAASSNPLYSKGYVQNLERIALSIARRRIHKASYTNRQIMTIRQKFPTLLLVLVANDDPHLKMYSRCVKKIIV